MEQQQKRFLCRKSKQTPLLLYGLDLASRLCLVLTFIASSLIEISKINGYINLQHKTDKERKRNINLSWQLISSIQAARTQNGDWAL